MIALSKAEADDLTSPLTKTYLDDYLIPEILQTLQNEQLISYKVEPSQSLDGFMSNIYKIDLKTISDTRECTHILLLKTMRGNKTFREASRSYKQFANEIFVYHSLLPAYEQFLKDMKIDLVNVQDWVPKCYVAKFGYIEGFSSTAQTEESVLVLQHLQPFNYKLGPKIYLNTKHLQLMAQLLGQYHGMSYAMKVIQPSKFNQLRNAIIPLPFIEKDGNIEKHNFYRVLYRVAFERFFDYIERSKNESLFDKTDKEDIKLLNNLTKLKNKYFNEPTKLLEELRTKICNDVADDAFGVILHGDFNRNNVLFQLDEQSEAFNIKMLDFQELRYGSPALDLSFFMFFNTTQQLRSEMWSALLRCYHDNVLFVLTSVLDKSTKSSDEKKAILDLYSYEEFIKHFSRYAFYGVLICMHFLPWVLCSEEETQQLSDLFAIDVHGEEFHKISITAGGDEANAEILAAVRFANKMGYLDMVV